MIINFKSKGTGDFYHGITSKEARKIPHEIWKVACRKLDMLEAAVVLNDLRVPPANRLELLKGKLIILDVLIFVFTLPPSVKITHGGLCGFKKFRSL